MILSDAHELLGQWVDYVAAPGLFGPESEGSYHGVGFVTGVLQGVEGCESRLLIAESLPCSGYAGIGFDVELFFDDIEGITVRSVAA